MTTYSIRIRIAAVAIYAALLYGANAYITGRVAPSADVRSIWVATVLIPALLLHAIQEPHFSTARTAAMNAAAVLLAACFSHVPAGAPIPEASFLRSITIGTSVLMLFASVAALLSERVEDENRHRISASLKALTEQFGRPHLLFFPLLLFVVAAYHWPVAEDIAVIFVAWIAVTQFQIVERFLQLAASQVRLWRGGTPGVAFGQVLARQVPGTIILRHTRQGAAGFGRPMLVRDGDGRACVALLLDTVGYSDGTWLRAMIVGPLCSREEESLPLPGKDDSFEVDESKLLPGEWKAGARAIYESRAELIGIVAANTDLRWLRIELVRLDLAIEEGRLVRATIGDRDVLYQIVNGLTQEEILRQKDTRGYVRVDAKKVGVWNSDRKEFEKVGWIPRPNAPVFLVHQENSVGDADAIGFFPHTNFRIRVDPHSLVTHNAAILGILGVGKTYLALELVERLLLSDIKVVVLDLTDEYAKKLGPRWPMAHLENELQELRQVGEQGKNNFRPNQEEGGSVHAFRAKLADLLQKFLKPENKKIRLLAFNPASFLVWKQVGFYKGADTGMASLTPAAITRIFAESILEIVQSMGQTDKARCCLVLEEAHSLVPELNAIAAEGDKNECNGTAKAVLQGRKFGFGVLLVTQRTANVTKSILNQCNTVFAMRVYDATGADFLKNYIGDDFTSVLSQLDNQHAVVFGKASSCKDPVVIRVNDRDVFERLHPVQAAIQAALATEVAPC